MSNDKKKTGRKNKGDIQVLERQKVKRPRRYKVVLHNDDYTPRRFVVQVLEEVFRLSQAQAASIMMHVHNNGRGIVGTYSHEIAESKSQQTNKLARGFGYPLTTTTEPE